MVVVAILGLVHEQSLSKGSQVTLGNAIAILIIGSVSCESYSAWRSVTVMGMTVIDMVHSLDTVVTSVIHLMTVLLNLARQGRTRRGAQAVCCSLRSAAAAGNARPSAPRVTCV
ncbi:hypothetical protein BD289DRAFT_428367 [Coniella lustricola]|uniref:Uncharacterized protein n=1 Tax=Coniella lustricola TaxID=2025994 RepID=A0A2T3AE96_9PEZI|nr:hypothetical protein BD289DRAFT_428367 [Coniella lustricola]